MAKKMLLLMTMLATGIGATQRDEARDQLYDISHRIQFEVKVYPVDLRTTRIHYYHPERPLVFAYAFATVGEAFNFARIVTHRGLEVDFCPPGDGIRTIFPTIAKIEVSRKTCRPGLCDTDVACIPQ